MKAKILFCLLVVLGITSVTYSQKFATDQGAAWLSGTGTFTSSGGDLYEDDGERNTTLNLGPSLNYFIAQNIFIGGSLAFSRNASGNDSYTSLGIGPTLGFTFATEQSASFPFLVAGISYMSMGDDDDTISGRDIKLGGGVIMSLRQHLGIVIEAGYHMTTLNYENWDEPVSGNILAIGIGITGLIF